MPTERFIFFECRETMHHRTLTDRIEKSVRKSGSFFRQSETMEGKTYGNYEEQEFEGDRSG